MVNAFRILESLGPGVVTTLVVGDPTDVTGLQMYGERAGSPSEGAISIANFAHGAESQCQAIHDAAARRAAGVVLRGPVDERAERLAGDRQVTLGVLADDVGWIEFISMTDAMLRQVSAPLDNADAAHQQLFRLADEVADLLQAPVTIEDVLSQVMAYSALGGTADAARMSTILGRTVPQRIVTQLRAAGTFRRLRMSDEPFTVDIEDPDFLTRLVIPLHVGPELVGSIWAIRGEGLARGDRQELNTLGRSLGLLLVRLRAHDELSTSYTTDRVRRAFHRSRHDSEVEELVLPGRQVRVGAMDRVDGTSPHGDLSLWGAIFRRHGWAHPILADVEGEVFAILTDGEEPGSWAWARSLSLDGHIGPVGASRSTRSAADLPTRKNEALDVLRAGKALDRTAVDYEEVWAQVVIRSTRAVVPGDAIDGISGLEGKGRERTGLTETLLAWLMSWGNYNHAAQRLGLHPNTVRQRMRRIEPLLHGVDLVDPDQRLALTLVLQAHVARDKSRASTPDGARDRRSRRAGQGATALL